MNSTFSTLWPNGLYLPTTVPPSAYTHEYPLLPELSSLRITLAVLRLAGGGPLTWRCAQRTNSPPKTAYICRRVCASSNTILPGNEFYSFFPSHLNELYFFAL